MGKEAEEAKQIWSEAADLCRKNNLTRVLAIIDVPGVFPTYAAYEVSSDPESWGWERHVKAAMVYTDKERYENNVSETVAFNRYINIRGFMDESDARRWLAET
ncbi:MAG: hypothetical protein ACR2QZ_15510 [Woeseiaceae bacterium]